MTTALETAPLVLLFLASIVMLKIVDRRDAKRALANLNVVGEQDARKPFLSGWESSPSEPEGDTRPLPAEPTSGHEDDTPLEPTGGHEDDTRPIPPDDHRTGD